MTPESERLRLKGQILLEQMEKKKVGRRRIERVADNLIESCNAALTGNTAQKNRALRECINRLEKLKDGKE